MTKPTSWADLMTPPAQNPVTVEAGWDQLPDWTHGHELAIIPGPDSNGYEGDHVPTADIAQASIITSATTGEDGDHRPILDIDFPVHVEPSSTPGHFHLYLDKPMPWGKYVRLLNALADCGIVEHGYVSASKDRRYTAVRLPWVRKGKR